MAKSAIFDKATAATALVVLVVLLFTGINPLYAILAGLFIGFIILQIKGWLGLDLRMEKEGQNTSPEESNYPEYYI